VLDRERRDAFRDVYRFARRADDLADGPGEPAAIAAQLAGMREELDAIYSGQAREAEARRLARTVRCYQLERGHFDRLLDTLLAEVGGRTVADWPALEAYCDAVAGSLARLSLQILGAEGPAAIRYAGDVAIAMQLANILRDLREDTLRGRSYLPEDELAEAGLDRARVIAELHRGRMSPALASVCRRQGLRAREFLERGRRALPAAQRRPLVLAEIWADVYTALLDQLEAQGYDVFAHRPYLPRRRKLVLLARRYGQSMATRSPPRIFPRPRCP
jgi:phytoene synthase